MTQSSGAPWPLYALAASLAGAIAAAILVVGPASSGDASSATRTIAAERGVVQSTVSGSGNIEPASQLDLGFQASGTVTQIDVSQGEQVARGQLIATLDPQSAEVALEQAKATLQSAEASLSREEETDGESSAQSEPARASATGATASAPAASSTAISTATREANLASTRAAVKSDRLAVEGAEQSVADTRLVAPQSGTIVSLSGEVGETVSGGGTSRASSPPASASSSAGATGAEGSGRGSATGSSGTASSSTSTAFAVLSDLSATPAAASKRCSGRVENAYDTTKELDVREEPHVHAARLARWFSTP